MILSTHIYLSFKYVVSDNFRTKNDIFLGTYSEYTHYVLGSSFLTIWTQKKYNCYYGLSQTR